MAVPAEQTDEEITELVDTVTEEIFAEEISSIIDTVIINTPEETQTSDEGETLEAEVITDDESV